MAQVLCKSEDLSPNTEQSHKNGQAVYICNGRATEADTGRSCTLTGQVVKLQAPGSVGGPVSKWKRKRKRKKEREK